MQEIYIKGVDLPGKIKGVTVVKDNDFIILINTCLCEEVQQQTISHELSHVKKNHFYNCDPVIKNEMEANNKEYSL